MREKWRKKRMRRLKRKRRQNRKWSASTSYLNYLFILPYYHFFLVTSSVLEHAKGNKRKIYCFAHSRKNYLRTKSWTIDEEGSKLKAIPNCFGLSDKFHKIHGPNNEWRNICHWNVSLSILHYDNHINGSREVHLFWSRNKKNSF